MRTSSCVPPGAGSGMKSNTTALPDRSRSWSPAPWCQAGTAGRCAPPDRTRKAARRHDRGCQAGRRRSPLNRSAAGTATRSCRHGEPVRRSRSIRSARNPRSDELASPRAKRDRAWSSSSSLCEMPNRSGDRRGHQSRSALLSATRGALAMRALTVPLAPAILPPTTRRLAGQPPEGTREMALVNETQLQRDGRERLRALGEKRLRLVYPHLQDPPTRRRPG